MKRTVFLAMALFALMVVGVYAQTEADFEVYSDGKTIEIEGYKGSATAVVIPARIKNLPVTIIGSAFASNDKITSVTIPNGVTTIGDKAFQFCLKLASVNIPDSVTSIGSNAFVATSINSLAIPNSVKSIGSTAFLDCTKFASVTIGSGVTSIATQAFKGTVPTSVTFGGTIPSSGFHAAAFPSAEFGDLRDKYLAGGAGTYTRPNDTSKTWTKGATTAAAGTPGLAFALTADGKGYSVSKGTVGKGDVVIPASYNNLPITEIAPSGFAAVANIDSVNIPNSVTTIGNQAFMNCTFLKSVTIGSGVQRIDTIAFQGCASLTSVTFNGTIPSGNFNGTAFNGVGDLRAKYIAGGIGTYTRPQSGTTWTKK